MNRRELLTRFGTVVLLLPAGYAFWGCDTNQSGGGGTDTGGGGGGGTDTGAQDAGADAVGGTLTFTSSSVGNHTHMLTLELTVIASPPAAGVDRDTTTDNAHKHTVSLTEADLQAIDAGQTVTKETSTSLGHTHSFELVKS